MSDLLAILNEAHEVLSDTPTGSNVFGWRVPTPEDYDRVAAALDRLSDAVSLGVENEFEWCIEHKATRVDDETDKCWVRLAAWDKVECRFGCAFVTVWIDAAVGEGEQ